MAMSGIPYYLAGLQPVFTDDAKAAGCPSLRKKFVAPI